MYNVHPKFIPAFHSQNCAHYKRDITGNVNVSCSIVCYSTNGTTYHDSNW